MPFSTSGPEVTQDQLHVTWGDLGQLLSVQGL
jgi:hypothetical protein